MSRTFRLTVNGVNVSVEAEESRPLLAVLRDDLGLKGARFGCGLERCGACMVLIDGTPAFSCGREMDGLDGRSVTTVEGLAALDALREAFVAEQAAQCGYCISGIMVAAAALLARNLSPTRGDVAAALDDNLCRCGAHNRIIRAVQRAGAALSGQAT